MKAAPLHVRRASDVNPALFTVLQLTAGKAFPLESATALLGDLHCIGDIFF